MANIPANLRSRHVALEVLGAANRGGRSLDDALFEHAGFAELEPRDRAFVRNLLALTYRRRGQIEALLGSFLAKPLPTQDAIVGDILALGLAQLLFLNTPAHAAVDTSVRLTETIGRMRLKGLVNAVMRRATREGAALVERQDAARINTPDWLWRSWLQAYGPDTARAIATAHLTEAPLDFTLRGEMADWAQKLEAEILPTGSLRRIAGGAVRELPGFAEGAWWIQDAAAALPAKLLGDVKDKRVLDLCAAPGGKTLQLAAAGARVIAVDVSPQRLHRLTDNLKRTNLKAELVGADAAIFKPAGPIDAILLDAPCTSTGTIRRHPDASWRRRPDDVSQMAQLQRKLLDHAVALLPKGALLVYAVCSLQKEEGEAQIDRLLAPQIQGAAPVELVPVTANELPGLAEAILPAGLLGGTVRTLPSQWAESNGIKGGLDGFFIARLRKR